MKVVLINTYDIGGAGYACTRLHLSLLQEGVESTMLTLHKTRNDVPFLYKFVNNHKATIGERIKRKIGSYRSEYEKHLDKLKGQEEGHELFSSAHTDFNLFSSPHVHNADIINFHWVDGFFDYRALAGISKPLVWTFHDMSPFTGGCHYSEGCEKYKNECQMCPQLRGADDRNYSATQLSRKQKALYSKKVHIITPSHWLAECARSSRLFSSSDISVVPNSLDLEVFKPMDKEEARRELNIPFGKKVLLFISHNVKTKRKGFVLLQKALEMIRHKDVCLVSVGSIVGEESNEERIFLGEIKDERKMALVCNAADAFILPSLEDNLPNVAIEAIACGTPVIAFPVGGLTDILNGSNGLLSKEISVSSLSSAIDDFLDGCCIFDRDEIRNSAMRFSSRNQVNGYLEVYNKVLSTYRKEQ